MTDRSDFTNGLRELADILDANPDLPLPYSGTGSELLWIARHGEDHKAFAQTFARVVPGTLTKSVRGTDFDLIGSVGGVQVQLIVDRDAVCERVVTGIETVTISAKPATDPEPERTEERELVEWRCQPLLAEEVTA
jgi:hypothetical protein